MITLIISLYLLQIVLGTLLQYRFLLKPASSRDILWIPRVSAISPRFYRVNGVLVNGAGDIVSCGWGKFLPLALPVIVAAWIEVLYNGTKPKTEDTCPPLRDSSHLKILGITECRFLKELGYPQGIGGTYYTSTGDLVTIGFHEIRDHILAIDYLEAWHWLWEAKGIKISVTHFDSSAEAWLGNLPGTGITTQAECPAEAIEKLIKKLAEK